MSLYSNNFIFLQRPERSSLSWGEENTRAILPNFENVDQLRQFVSRLFDYDFRVPNLNLQLKIGVGFECFILLISSLIVGRRIYEGNFWVFRFIKTSSGSILVPNTMLSFIVTETVFKIVFISLLLEFTRFYNFASNGPPNFLLWILLPWCSLIFGAFLSAVGTYYATPKGIRRGIKKNDHSSNMIKRFFFHAWTANIIAFTLPTLTCISVAIPSFIANAHYMQARSEQILWLNEYALSTQFNQAMVLQAQSIWYKSLGAMKIASITYLLWFGWAMICFLIYTALSLRLLKAIIVEMRKSKMEELKFMVTTMRIPNQQDEEEDIPLTQLSLLKSIQVKSDDHGSNEDHGTIVEHQNNQFQIINPNQNDSRQDSRFTVGFANSPTNEDHSQNRDRDRLTNKDSEQTLQSQTQPHHQSLVQQSLMKENPTSPQTTITNKFSKLILNQNQLTKKSKEIQLLTLNEQKKELRKAFLNILAQVSVISPGCIIMGSIALFLALTIYGGYEQPLPIEKNDQIGNYLERFIGIALIWVIWSIVLLGLFIFCCVLFRVYEPIFVKIQSDQGSSIDGLNSNITYSKNSYKFHENRISRNSMRS